MTRWTTLSLFGCVLLAFSAAGAEAGFGVTSDALSSAAWEVPGVDAAQVALSREWQGSACTLRLTNVSNAPVSPREVVLFRLPHALPPETGLYGEGFSMLSQTGGTLGKPENIGGYTDRDHYRIPQAADATTVYNMLLLSPPEGGHLLMGFTSCRRFAGCFRLRPDSLEVVLDLEGLPLAPGAALDLEGFWFAAGPDREALLAAFAEKLSESHPRLPFPAPPTGWCSWYCFGPGVTSRQVMRNLEFIKTELPQLRYVQIDDGYQAAMGDWLETGRAFKGGIKDLLAEIRKAGFEPAIWVAPFIAEENSRVFREHPEWFMKDEAGQPLRSDKVTFGGWRNGPWYALDGTHPGAREHLESVFRTMREEWGCTYFKLDANFWGTMHGGRLHDPAATRVEAYRRGMEAVLRGAGDAFILGCNHPLWPSLGVVHGARSSGDITRSWDVYRGIARENFHRNWQNGRLWWNDPDCVLLSGKLPENEYFFHASVALASGGMLLSGDNLPVLSAERLAMLKKLLPPSGVSARFDGSTFDTGRIALPDKTLVCVFNWSDEARTAQVKLDAPGPLTDFWTGAAVEMQDAAVTLADMPPHSARVLVCPPGNGGTR